MDQDSEQWHRVSLRWWGCQDGFREKEGTWDKPFPSALRTLFTVCSGFFTMKMMLGIRKRGLREASATVEGDL